MLERKLHSEKHTPQKKPVEISWKPGYFQVDSTWGEIQPMQLEGKIETIGERELIWYVREKNALLLDCRPHEDFLQAKIPDSLNFSGGAIDDSILSHYKGRMFIVYCYGPQSYIAPDALAMMREKGISDCHLKYYRGGMRDWLIAGYPLDEEQKSTPQIYHSDHEEKVLFIKDMVCSRCIYAVYEILEKQPVKVQEVRIGEARILDTENQLDLERLDRQLQEIGLSLVKNKTNQLTEQIKSIIVDLVHNSNYRYLQVNMSNYLQEKLGKDYHYLSSVFSEKENLTIEKFYIQQKIEKVKSLIFNDELRFNEIAAKMGYSSSAYLSNQFKQITGMSPTEFKKLISVRRKHDSND